MPLDKEYAMHHGDVIPFMFEDMEPESIDFAVTSVPFPSVYSYSSSEADVGNSEDMRGEVKLHFSFFFRSLLRVMKPGRVVMIHCMDVVRLKRSGGEGIFNFRDLLVRLGERAGFHYEYSWTIRVNPQQQAIRNRSWELKFQGIETDRAQCRGALPDYVVKFQVPGVNKVPVVGEDQVSRNDWIDWAECTWDDIVRNDTLNNKKKYRPAVKPDDADGPDDTRHICPLQMGLIERLIRLYTNPGELVFDPFAGVGSTGYAALTLGRKFIGADLKGEYHAAAVRNLERALVLRQEQSRSLFDFAEASTLPDKEEVGTGKVKHRKAKSIKAESV